MGRDVVPRSQAVGALPQPHKCKTLSSKRVLYDPRIKQRAARRTGQRSTRRSCEVGHSVRLGGEDCRRTRKHRRYRALSLPRSGTSGRFHNATIQRIGSRVASGLGANAETVISAKSPVRVSTGIPFRQFWRFWHWQCFRVQRTMITLDGRPPVLILARCTTPSSSSWARAAS